MADSSPNLTELRKELDELDADMVDLLNRRASIALQVKQAKQRDRIQVYAPERERQILDRVVARSQGPFPARQLQKIFLNILSATRSLIGDMQVVCLGAEHSLCHHAGIAQFGEHASYRSARSIEEVFARVERGDAAYGVVPARSGSAGLVTRTFDLLMESQLRIIAEVEVKDRLAFFSAAASPADVRTIYGLPEHFERAKGWLATHASAAERMVHDEGADPFAKLESDTTVGILAIDCFADRGGRTPLATGIEDGLVADARCIVIGDQQPAPTGRDKTSLLCSVPDRAGALRDILRPFAEHGVTLLKIESRPMRNRAWEFVFFIDCAGHCSEDEPKAAIEELSALCPYVKVLGSYPLVCHS